MELGEKLRKARLEAGLSQRQLCGEEITRNMLSLIENGSAKPSMKTLQYLAAGNGTSGDIQFSSVHENITALGSTAAIGAYHAAPEGAAVDIESTLIHIDHAAGGDGDLLPLHELNSATLEMQLTGFFHIGKGTGIILGVCAGSQNHTTANTVHNG